MAPHSLTRPDRRLAWLLLSPAFALTFALIGAPILRAVWMSVHVVDLKRRALGQPYVGLEHYRSLLSDSYFLASLGRTLYFMVASVGIELVLGFAIALLLNQRFRGRGLLRAIILVPWALPITIDAIMWKWILNPDYGALNSLLLQIGLIDSYQTWLSRPGWALHMVMLADVWKVTPLVSLLLLAGLQTIPAELYEAARVDGATALSTLRHVTLPLLTPLALVVIVLRSMDAFKLFDLVYIMTSGGPSDATKVIAYHTYLETFSFLRFGRGAAMAVVMTLIVIGMVGVYVRLLRVQTER